MKVKMLEELVSRIDGKPVSGVPLFLGGRREGGGRLTRLPWDPPTPAAPSAGPPGAAGAGAIPVPFMKVI